jgi:hypothetical protein
VLGVGTVLVQSGALLAIQVAGALLSVRAPSRQGRLGGSPLAGGLFGLFGYFLLGVGVLIGTAGALLGALLALLGGGWVFARLRDPVLAGLVGPKPPDDEERALPSRYRRVPP